jgi:drug/metabolite transporter (DMT)-like permease
VIDNRHSPRGAASRIGATTAKRFGGELILLTTVSLWSLNFAATKVALESGFLPMSTATLRILIAALILGSLTFAREQSLTFRKRDHRLLVASALLGMWISPVAIVHAIDRSSAATVALLMGTFPAFVVLAAAALGRERFGARASLATLISFGGAALVALGAGVGPAGGLSGVVLALTGALTWAAYSVLVGPLMKSYSPLRIFAVVLLIATPPLVVSSSLDLARQDWRLPSAFGWIALLYGALFALCLANVLWLRSIDHVGPTRAALYANLQPFMGAVFGVWLLSEGLGPLQILGGAVIGIGIVFARRRVQATATHAPR